MAVPWSRRLYLRGRASSWNGWALPIAQLLFQCRNDDAAEKLRRRASLLQLSPNGLTDLTVDAQGRYQAEMPAGAAHQPCASSASKSPRRVSWPLSASATQHALPSSTQLSCASLSSPFFSPHSV